MIKLIKILLFSIVLSCCSLERGLHTGDIVTDISYNKKTKDCEYEARPTMKSNLPSKFTCPCNRFLIGDSVDIFKK